MWSSIVKKVSEYDALGYETRMAQIRHLKTEIAVDSQHTIVTTFKLIFKGESIVFAFLYSTENGHKYYCANPSFESKDGEYRPKVSRYENLDIISKTYPQMIEEIDDYVTSKKSKMNWTIEIEHFCHQDSCSMNIAGLGHRLLLVMWYGCIYNIYYGMIEVHLNEKFNRIFGFGAADMQFFKSLESKYGHESVRHLRQLQDYYYANPDLETSVRLGQKIIPLSLIEAQRPFSIGYKPWRELLVGGRLSDLVVNRICPAFAISSTYFYIYQGDRMLFDNEAQIMRIDVSRSALLIARTLTEAKKQSQFEEWEDDKIVRMKELLDEPLLYSKQELIMSEVALCIFTEFMGKTLHNAIQSAMRSDLYNRYIGNILNKSSTMRKFMFEYVYALLCVNHHYGIIHGDLHLNNLSIHATYSSALRDLSTQKTFVAYDVLGKIFLLPSTQYYGSLIDFSRCLILPSKLPLLMNRDLERSPKSTGIKDVGTLIIYIIARVRCLYKTYLPDFYAENMIAIEVGIRERFPDVFHLLTAFDPFMLCSKLRDFLRNPDNIKRFDKDTYDSNIEFLNSIIKKCTAYLTTDFIDHIGRLRSRVTTKMQTMEVRITAPDPTSSIIRESSKQNATIQWKEPEVTFDVDEYPNFKLLMGDEFSEFRIGNKIDKEIIDRYSFSAPLTYSLDDYSSFPPIFKKSHKKFVVVDATTVANLRHIEEIAKDHLYF